MCSTLDPAAIMMIKINYIVSLCTRTNGQYCNNMRDLQEFIWKQFVFYTPELPLQLRIFCAEWGVFHDFIRLFFTMIYKL